LIKNLQVYSRHPSLRKKEVHSLISALKKELSFKLIFLSISFIRSDDLRKINKDFLSHDYETDVITFNYSKKKKLVDGEILISLDEAKSNAKKYNVSFGRELMRLVTHGILHLLHFDDKNAGSKKIMKKEENRLINRYNFALFAGKY
jgi:rRNA maturation RNase YbeY